MPETLEVIESTDADIAARLVDNLQVVLKNTNLLKEPKRFTTQLEFPNEWGLDPQAPLRAFWLSARE